MRRKSHRNRSCSAKKKEAVNGRGGRGERFVRLDRLGLQFVVAELKGGGGAAEGSAKGAGADKTNPPRNRQERRRIATELVLGERGMKVPHQCGRGKILTQFGTIRGKEEDAIQGSAETYRIKALSSQ